MYFKNLLIFIQQTVINLISSCRFFLSKGLLWFVCTLNIKLCNTEIRVNIIIYIHSGNRFIIRLLLMDDVVTGLSSFLLPNCNNVCTREIKMSLLPKIWVLMSLEDMLCRYSLYGCAPEQNKLGSTATQCCLPLQTLARTFETFKTLLKWYNLCKDYMKISHHTLSGMCQTKK